MSGETIVTLCGRLTNKPELRYTADNTPVCNSTLASTPRRFDKATGQWVDQKTMFVRLTAWRELAENMAASFSSGDRVIVTGPLQVETYDTRPTDGTPPQPRQAQLVTVEEIGASVRFARVDVHRVTSGTHAGPVDTRDFSGSADSFLPSDAAALAAV